MIVAYDMGEWPEIPDVVKLGLAEAAVWFTTFVLTVFADLAVAVEAGMVLEALLTSPRHDADDDCARHAGVHHHGRALSLQLHDIPEHDAIYRIHGPFLFGATSRAGALADVPHATGRTLILCGMRDQPGRMMERAEFHQHIGDVNLVPTVEAALRRARGVLLGEDGLTPAA